MKREGGGGEERRRRGVKDEEVKRGGGGGEEGRRREAALEAGKEGGQRQHSREHASPTIWETSEGAGSFSGDVTLLQLGRAWPTQPEKSTYSLQQSACASVSCVSFTDGRASRPHTQHTA